MLFDSRDYEAFFKDLNEDGFHIYSRKHAKESGFYPPPCPQYPEVDLTTLKEGDRITVRAFFAVGKKPNAKIDSGHMDLEVEHIDREHGTLIGEILIELPPMFALAQGTSLEVAFDEVLAVLHD